MARTRHESPAAPAPMSKEQQRLRAFAADFLALAGCSVREQEEELHASLPQEASALFGTDELRLAFHAHSRLDPSVHLLQPGSVVLERMVAHLRERVGVSLAEIPAQTPPGAELPAELSFRCEARLSRVDTEPEEYVTFHFRTSFVSDEKNEELSSVTIDSEGRAVEDPVLLARLVGAPAREGALETSRRALGALYAAAEERARTCAEQTATRYEQDTLPRLYREITRLRAFYQAQIAELDPTLEQDAALRDHYERELRLRTDEEIQNHRMTVSLALVSFRVVCVPRAQYRIRLRSPHAQRAVTVERDLATGQLLPPSCEACGKPLHAADLCAGGHLACPECLHACAACGRLECAACGLQTCAQCGKAVCGECRVSCAACANTVCREHTRPCPVCGRRVCEGCLKECALCGAVQCASHVAACATCGRVVCTHCREACAVCGAVACDEHAGICDRCGQTLCPAHLARCSVCAAARCPAHLQTCSSCGALLCDDHLQECGGCGAILCQEHAERCHVCGVPACAACGPACALSGKRLCPEHAVICETCGRTVAPEQSDACSACGKKACSEHLAECAGCGALLCDEDIAPCHVCREPFCPDCSPGYRACSTCSDPEAGESVCPEEVLDLTGFDPDWGFHVPRLAWRCVVKRDRFIYYGTGPAWLLVVQADLDGVFTGAKRFGQYQVPERWYPWRTDE